MSTDAAIVLAGGASRRMGRDKGWLELDGRPLLAHVIELLGRRCAPIVVSARPGQQLPAVAGIELLRVDDPVADAGPIVGLLAALERLADLGIERAYLSSCDAAGLDLAHVDFMLARLWPEPARPERLIAAVPIDAEGRRHPLAAALELAGMRARAETQLAAGDQRMQALFAGPRVLTISADELPDPTVLEPCNTPAQWQALRARLLTRRARGR